MSLLNLLAVYGPGVTGRSLGGPKEDLKVFIQHDCFPIATHMEAPLQLTFTNLCSLTPPKILTTCAVAAELQADGWEAQLVSQMRVQ